MPSLTRFTAVLWVPLVCGPIWAYGSAWACEVTPEPLSFGVVDVERGSSVTSRIRVACDVPSSFTVGISSSSNGSTRQLLGPSGSMLLYQIFTDNTLSIPWGDGLSIGPVVGAENDGETETRLTLYGELFRNQIGASPGAYSDTITVTLSF